MVSYPNPVTDCVKISYVSLSILGQNIFLRSTLLWKLDFDRQYRLTKTWCQEEREKMYCIWKIPFSSLRNQKLSGQNASMAWRHDFQHNDTQLIDTTFSIIINKTWHTAKWQSIVMLSVIYAQSVTYKHFMLRVIVLNVVMLSVVALMALPKTLSIW